MVRTRRTAGSHHAKTKEEPMRMAQRSSKADNRPTKTKAMAKPMTKPMTKAKTKAMAKAKTREKTKTLAIAKGKATIVKIGGMTLYEKQRLARIAENKARMMAEGIHSDLAKLASMRTARSLPSRFDLKKVKAEQGDDDEVHDVPYGGQARRPVRHLSAPIGPRRRSRRLEGVARVNYTIVKNEYAAGHSKRINVKTEYAVGAFEPLPANALPTNGARRRKVYDDEVNKGGDETTMSDSRPLDLPPHLKEHRCDSKGRGSVYDPVVGLCCHFCRQKKLCGEPNCDRCGRMDVTKRCMGKTECSRCESATGIFCRACILIRYGMSLEEVRATPNWICPHCTEADGSDPYWICNSSVCLKRHKLAPLGVAIYEARRHGYRSVAHLLKAKLQGLV